MKVSGSAVLHAPRDRVWQAFNDPAVLVRTIPGCQRLETVGPDHYRMTVTAGVGTVKGTYSGEVRLGGQQQPASFVLRASGAGAPGTVSADVLVRLDDDGDGATRLVYDADAIVGGMIGGVGQRMLTGVAKKTAGEFFAAVDDVLTGAAEAAPAAEGAAVLTGSVAGAAMSVGAARAGVSSGGVPGPATAAGEGVSAVQGPQAGAQPGMYEAPTPSPSRIVAAVSGDFARGVVAGAVVALAGVVVGGWIAGRRR